MIEFGATVLVVDDEDVIRLTLQRVLEAAGYQVLIASGGQEALKLCCDNRVEVMLLDVKMPGLSGLDVLQKVAAGDLNLEVIMVTAVSETRVAVEAMKTGAYDYLLKPFDLDDLVMRVRRAQEHRRLVLRERESEEKLEQRVRDQELRLKDQFSELIQGLAREHALALEVGALTKAQKAKGLFAKLPTEFQKPKASVEEFAQALLSVIQQGRLGKT